MCKCNISRMIQLSVQHPAQNHVDSIYTGDRKKGKVLFYGKVAELAVAISEKKTCISICSMLYSYPLQSP